MKVLIGVTGSVAAVKVVELVRALRAGSIEMKMIVTERATQFLTALDIQELKAVIGADVYTDEAEWKLWKQKGDPVLHIELRRWADLFLVCPLSANTLAKMANGICGNLLTSVVRAWDISKPIIVCPAMNTFMWDNPLTAQHLKSISDVYKARIVQPKAIHLLACGDTGAGALAAIEDVVNAVLEQVIT